MVGGTEAGKPGLLADRAFASVLLLNVSGVKNTVRCDHALGIASPCDTETNGDIDGETHQSAGTLIKCAAVNTVK